MKLNFQNAQGNVLLVTLFSIGIIGIGIASYLALVSQSNLNTMRSLSWNAAMPMADAGVEEALSQLTLTGGSNLSANGWTASGTNYIKSRALTGGRYQVAISSNSGTYYIKSTGYVQRPDATNEIARTLQITASKKYLQQGFVFKDSVDMTGSVFIDSFDSSNPLYSTNGAYVASRNKANALVASNSSTNTFKLWGNLTIKGRAAVGPGGTTTIGGSASVGDLTWNSKGFQSGHSTDDANFDLADAAVPAGTRYTPASGTVNGTNFTYVLNGGDYQISTISSAQKVIVTSASTIYVSGTFDPSIFIISPGTTVDIYLGSSNPSINAINNATGVASSCNVYGLPTVTSITLAGFTGTVYAPSADISMTGNGTFTGAVAAKSVSLGGSVSFHFDEALKGTNGVTQGLVVTAWSEN